MPLEAVRWTLAERYGWPLEYVDSLDIALVNEEAQVRDGIAKFSKYERDRKTK